MNSSIPTSKTALFQQKWKKDLITILHKTYVNTCEVTYIKKNEIDKINK